jgi:hypothetical protein
VVERRFEAGSVINDRRTEVTLEPGERREVTFEVQVRNVAPGDYDLVVATEDDSVTKTIRVNRPTVTVLDLQGPPSSRVATPGDSDIVRQGDRVTVSANVTNTQSTTVTETVTALVDFDQDDFEGSEFEPDDEVASRSVELPPGETRRVSFEVEVPVDQEPGGYAFRIATTDDSAEGEFAVFGDTPTTGDLFFERINPLRSFQPGETFGEAVEVSNRAPEGRTVLVDLRIDLDQDGTPEPDETIAQRLVTVAPDDTGVPTVLRGEYRIPEETPPGVYERGYVTGEDSTTGLVVVYDADAPATFAVEEPVERSGEAGGRFGVDFNTDVANIGGEEGTTTVELRVDLDGDGTLEASEVVDSRSLTLDPGSLEEGARFTWDIPEDTTPGEYRYGFFAGDVNETSTVTVTAPSA